MVATPGPPEGSQALKGRTPLSPPGGRVWTCLDPGCLPGHEEVDEEESWGEEDWGEEDWREEEDYEEDRDGEEAWAWEDEAEEHHAAAPTDWGGGDDTADGKGSARMGRRSMGFRWLRRVVVDS